MILADGVDFHPYLKALLTPVENVRIAQRVAVITDTDSPGRAEPGGQPDTDVTSRWRHCDPATDELLRTWCVAVTRARYLVGLAVQASEAAVLHGHSSACEVRSFVC